MRYDSESHLVKTTVEAFNKCFALLQERSQIVLSADCEQKYNFQLTSRCLLFSELVKFISNIHQSLKEFDNIWLQNNTDHVIETIDEIIALVQPIQVVIETNTAIQPSIPFLFKNDMTILSTIRRGLIQASELRAPAPTPSPSPPPPPNPPKSRFCPRWCPCSIL